MRSIASLTYHVLICLCQISDIRNLIELSEKAMAPHCSILAWRIPGTEEPSGLLSVGSHRVRHDLSDLAAAAAAAY